MKFVKQAIALFAIVALPAIAVAAQQRRDYAAEEANRKLVVAFYDQLFNAHEVEAASEMIADDYIQHNPNVPNGKEPVVSFLTGFFAENPDSKAEIVRSAADGHLVWLHVHSTNGQNDKGRAVVDIFRVENNMVVEHWDVIQTVPETAQNDNTMF